MTRGVFICYSTQEVGFVQRLVRDLKDHDIPVWFDEAELEPGDSILQKIEAGIDRMDDLIVIMSPASVDSQWVQEEIRMALHKGIAGRKFKVIPILKENCKIPGFLRDRKYVDMRLAADYPAGLEKIVRKIRVSLEFKDSLQRFQDDLQGLEAHDPELTRELGTEKVGDIERAISMVPRAISGEISEREWTQAAEQLRTSLGKGDVTFDQHNQRVKHQINIGTVTHLVAVEITGMNFNVGRSRCIDDRRNEYRRSNLPITIPVGRAKQMSGRGVVLSRTDVDSP